MVRYLGKMIMQKDKARRLGMRVGQVDEASRLGKNMSNEVEV